MDLPLPSFCFCGPPPVLHENFRVTKLAFGSTWPSSGAVSLAAFTVLFLSLLSPFVLIDLLVLTLNLHTPPWKGTHPRIACYLVSAERAHCIVSFSSLPPDRPPSYPHHKSSKAWRAIPLWPLPDPFSCFSKFLVEISLLLLFFFSSLPPLPHCTLFSFFRHSQQMTAHSARPPSWACSTLCWRALRDLVTQGISASGPQMTFFHNLPKPPKGLRPVRCPRSSRGSRNTSRR